MNTEAAIGSYFEKDFPEREHSLKVSIKKFSFSKALSLQILRTIPVSILGRIL